MKKRYITPGVMVVMIHTNHMLAESIFGDGSRTITNESNGSWTREENSSYSDNNVWDNEW